MMEKGFLLETEGGRGSRLCQVKPQARGQSGTGGLEHNRRRRPAKDLDRKFLVFVAHKKEIEGGSGNRKARADAGRRRRPREKVNDSPGNVKEGGRRDSAGQSRITEEGSEQPIKWVPGGGKGRQAVLAGPTWGISVPKETRPMDTAGRRKRKQPIDAELPNWSQILWKKERGKSAWGKRPGDRDQHPWGALR